MTTGGSIYNGFWFGLRKRVAAAGGCSDNNDLYYTDETAVDFKPPPEVACNEETYCIRTENGQYKDRPCDVPFPFICKKKSGNLHDQKKA